MAGGLKQIGQFLVLDEIGRGGMGIVYLAHDPELERDVAIKTLPERLTRDPSWLDQLVWEARALARLNHPNVAQIYSLETIESGRFLVLEYVPGESLAARLRRGKPDVKEALKICLQVTGGLEAAHNRGLVHRDLKPANIRITPDGCVKIIDFGLALSRPIAGAEGEEISSSSRRAISSMTTSPPHEFLVVGTPGYMSPEQSRGRPISKRSDIFSFGCVFFECLTGETAFRGSTPSEAILAVLEEEPNWSKLPLDTPAPIARLLPRCLEKDIGRRLCDIGDARLEIEAVLEKPAGMSTEGKPPRDVPHNLPLEVTSFVGREMMIDRLKSALDSTRFITLTGAGGCGKTRLALRLGKETLDRHPDGVWLVELAGVTDPSLVPASVARALKIDDRNEANLVDGIVGILERGRRLLILDNCEHLLESCRPLVDRLMRRCPELRILTTSRQSLGLPGEFAFSVPSLSLPGVGEPSDPDELRQYESVRLFVERAKMAQPSFQLRRANSLAVSRLCRQLDGIPLAIELAASRLKVLPVEQIEGKLEDRFRLLTGGSEVAVARHRTLRATVDWSYELLSDAEKRMFCRLSVFAAGWTLEGATAVCGEGLDELDVLDLLAMLNEKSLIFMDERAMAELPTCARYQMHETMRRYGREILTVDERTALNDRHCDFYLGVAERSAPAVRQLDAGAWQLLMRFENENLMAALYWSMAADDGSGRDVRLARALRQQDAQLAG